MFRIAYQVNCRFAAGIPMMWQITERISTNYRFLLEPQKENLIIKKELICPLTSGISAMLSFFFLFGSQSYALDARFTGLHEAAQKKYNLSSSYTSFVSKHVKACRKDAGYISKKSDVPFGSFLIVCPWLSLEHKNNSSDKPFNILEVLTDKTKWKSAIAELKTLRYT